MAKHSKRFIELHGKVDRTKNYYQPEAIGQVGQGTCHAKFDETVEVHLRMGVDPRYADQQVRGVVTLPGGTGRTVRILVFAGPDGQAIAQSKPAPTLWAPRTLARALRRAGPTSMSCSPPPT